MSLWYPCAICDAFTGNMSEEDHQAVGLCPPCEEQMKKVRTRTTSEGDEK